MHTGFAFGRDSLTGILLVLALCGGAEWRATPCQAQSVPSDLMVKDVTDPGVITNVVVYEEGAVVTRTLKRELGQGVWRVRVGGLPSGAGDQAIQASVAYGNDHAGASLPKLLGVEYAETLQANFVGSPEGVALANRVKDLQRQMEYLIQDDQLAEQQQKLVDQIGVRAGANATNDGGTQALNLDALRNQLEFVASERARIVALRRDLVKRLEATRLEHTAATEELKSRGSSTRWEREALVMIGVPDAGAVELQVSYIVHDAGWEPIYNVRSAGDRTGVQIEYDAMLRQASGEDWKDVRISLSTATPDRSSTPPSVEPWFIDVQPPPQARAKSLAEGAATGGGGGGFGGGGGGGNIFGSPGEMPERRGEIEKWSSSASVEEAGTSVSFDLPRPITVPSDDSKKQRTRIATVDPTSEFLYTAQPIVSQEVFLRGNLENTSAYQLLPGRAQIFMGGDYIGETEMPSVSPKDKFRVYFGPDRALRATRQLVSKTTGSSGFFGGDQSTTWNYRVTIDNSTGRNAKVELYDRRPVSRNDKIVVKLSNFSTPLSTDKIYTEYDAPDGILRWDLTVPASARGTAALPVTWETQVSFPNSMKTTPLPPD